MSQNEAPLRNPMSRLWVEPEGLKPMIHKYELSVDRTDRCRRLITYLNRNGGAQTATSRVGVRGAIAGSAGNSGTAEAGSEAKKAVSLLVKARRVAGAAHM
jgi:hypothetical protein